MKKNSKVIYPFIGLLLMVGIFCTSILIASRSKNEDGLSKKTIGALYMTMNNPYFEVLNQEIESTVVSHGDILIIRDSILDNETQIREMEEMIKEKVDLILLNSVDWKGISPALKDAKKAGIPVIAIDTDVYDSNLVESTLVSDNYHGGVMIARDLMAKREKGNVLLLIQSSNKSASDRIRGFLETLDKENWPYHLVDQLECDGQLEIAQPLVEKLLNENKKIDVVVALNDPSALGAMAALDAKGLLSDTIVYGVDGAPEAKSMVAANLMEGTVAQSPTLTGKYAAHYLYDLLDGKKIPKRKTIPVTLITSENINSYSLTNWE